jgi:hypothetical protein
MNILAAFLSSVVIAFDAEGSPYRGENSGPGKDVRRELDT